jgi:putative polyhydroxyalkanoate system protein
MSKMTFKVEHQLGKAEAMRRIREAAEKHKDKTSVYVKEMQWTSEGARVVGTGFSGEIRVGEREVTIDADLGFPASLMPMKIQREAESMLGKMLGP